MSEMEQATGDDRRRLFSNLAELRYAWSNVMNGIRGYLAFRGDSILESKAFKLVT